jgi:outer membrane protein insertion porin family
MPSPFLKSLRNPFLKSALLALVFLPIAALAEVKEGATIEEIRIEGQVTTEPQTILNAMQLKQGTPYSSAVQREDLQALANLGFFNPLELRITPEETDKGGVRLVISVKENPVIDSIKIIGNLEYKEERLLNELDQQAGDILPVAAKTKFREQIEKFYSAAGYTSVTANVSVEPVGEALDKVAVTIAIDEGERIKITDLRIEGNSHFSDWHIRTMVQNTGSWLVFNSYYDDRAFEQDLITVANRYRGDGYLDVEVRRGEFTYDEVKGTVSPQIVIAEGIRYKVGNVLISGRTLFTEAEVMPLFEALKGKSYNGLKFQDSIEGLRKLYGDQGYQNVEINGTFQKSADAGLVDLVLNLKENDVVYVGDIIIKTKNYEYNFDLNALERFIDYTSPGVNEETVEREVKLKPGEKFRTVNQVRTEDRLEKLGFFEKVDVTRRPTGDPNVDDAVIEVEEDPSASFVSVYGGYGEVSGPVIGANYTNPNLFGDARVLQIGASIGTNQQTARISYLDRYIGDTSTSMELALYRDYVEYLGYSQEALGGSVEFGRDLSEYVRGYLRFRAENIELVRLDEDVEEDLRTYRVFAVRGLAVRDTTNGGRWTYEGYKATAGVETGYARHVLVKFTHTYDQYFSLSRDNNWVYAYGHQAGIIPFSAEQIGISERFFLGGQSNLRGFRPRGAGPKDEGDDRMVVGGGLILTQRHEIRHRFNRYISGRWFVDAGLLGSKPFELGALRVGTGPGASFDVGPFVVDVDLATQLAKDNTDQTRFFHFKFRSNF